MAVRCSLSRPLRGKRPILPLSTRTSSAAPRPRAMPGRNLPSMRANPPMPWAKPPPRSAAMPDWRLSPPASAGCSSCSASLPPATTACCASPGPTGLRWPIPADLADLLTSPRPLVLLHSAEAARHFAAECARLALPRASIHLAALGPRVAEAAGQGWASLHMASATSDEALLALARQLCQEPTKSTKTG